MITARTFGTVVGHDREGHTVVQFDRIEGATEWWKQGTVEYLPFISGANPGDRVLLQYERGFGYARWYGRTIDAEK